MCLLCPLLNFLKRFCSAKQNVHQSKNQVLTGVPFHGSKHTHRYIIHWLAGKALYNEQFVEITFFVLRLISVRIVKPV